MYDDEVLLQEEENKYGSWYNTYKLLGADQPLISKEEENLSTKISAKRRRDKELDFSGINLLKYDIILTS